MSTTIVPAAAGTCDPIDLARSGRRTTFSARYLQRTHGFSNLFTPDGYNPKVKKGRARGYSTAIMHWSPARKGFDPKTGLLTNTGAQNVCKDKSPGCEGVCLDTAGQGGIVLLSGAPSPIHLARASRKQMFFKRRPEFNDLMVCEVATHVRRAGYHAMAPAVRPNGTSDMPWEVLTMNDGRTILATFPTVQFYDYTKTAERAIANARGKHPANYHLTFSRSEKNEEECLQVLAAGGNVAVVFAVKTARRNKPADPLPATWHGYRVVDADSDDLRFLDPRGVVCGLRAKGKAKHDTSGFVVTPTEANA